MNYNEILKRIALQERKSQAEIENAMKAALQMAGWEGSVEDFIIGAAMLCRRGPIGR
jgi:hypothetical protein